MLTIVAGWDFRELTGCNVCQFSAIRRTTEPLRFVPLMERVLRHKGLYRRPHEQRNGQTWDVISDAPMATSFANSRFLAPWLAEGSEWALSCDFADMLFLDDPAKLFALADDQFAVQVVKHRHEPPESTKMDEQIQTRYARKNWSSVILWNLTHPANQHLTLAMVNELPGRDLHAFCWLEDHEIGALPGSWNHLVGFDLDDATPSLLHYTAGTPELDVIHPVWASAWLRERSIMESTRSRVWAAA